MSMTVDELEGVSLAVTQYMETLSNSILNEIIDRIKEGQTISRTTDYLIWRYSQIYGFNEKVKEYIAEATGLLNEQLEKIFSETIEKGYARDEELYTAAGKEQIPFEENEELQQYISGIKEQTKQELTNITGTTGYMVNVNGQKVYTPTSYTLQRALDKGVSQVIEGTKDANTAVKEVVKELTDSGLRTVDYATGKHLTVESAARMCVMTGLGQVTGKIEEQNMDSLETPYVEVSWHATARPSHQVWQGRVFYWKEKDKNSENNLLQTKDPSDTMTLGVGDGSSDGDTKREYIGTIDIDKVEEAMRYFSDEIRDYDVENAIVINSKGEVVRFKSSSSDSVDIFDVDLNGAYITHNHPASNGIVSFGQDDFYFLREHPEIGSLRCCNEMYDYEVSVIKDMSHVTYNEIYREGTGRYTEGEDIHHLVFEVLKERGYVRYDRIPRKAN